ncbi:hypothetical protein DRN74_04070, partial [Candidatus Micrarchaeota archaeon]
NILLQTKPAIEEHKNKIKKLFKKNESKLKVISSDQIIKEFKQFLKGKSSYEETLFKLYYSKSA